MSYNLKQKRWFKIARAWLLSVVALFVSFLLIDAIFPFGLNDKGFARTVFAKNGLPLRKFADANGIWRVRVSNEQVSANYLQALLTYEDQYFYRHPGVNPFSMVRAARQWLTEGKIVSGGSTITMQVVRLIEPNSRNVMSKARQIFRAIQLEWHYSKSEILDYYLNHAPFGGTLEGVEAASWHYFGHGATNLTDAQAALLAVLPQSPSFHRPDRHHERAKLARDKVLSRLDEFGVWPTDRVNLALQEPLYIETEQLPTLAPLLSRKLLASSQSTSIQTHIDYDLQRGLSTLLSDYVQVFGKKVSAAALVVDNRNEQVVAYKGSADFNDNDRFAHVDMTAAQRSPGSTFKPFVYGLALAQGLIHSKSLLQDVPMTFGDYIPDNFEKRFLGPVAADKALQRSLNLPAVFLLDQLTPKAFYAEITNARVSLELPNNAKPNLSLALGGFATNLTSLVKLYASLANGGKVKGLQFLEGQGEKVEFQLLSPEAAWVTWKMLYDNPDKKLNYLRQSGFALKTGTSYSHRDIWAVAVAEDYTVGVWLGRPDNVPLSGHYGSRSAVPLVSRIANLLPHRQSKQIEQPALVSSETICWPSGQRSAASCDVKHQGWIIDQTYPATLLRTSEANNDLYLKPLTLNLARDTGKRVPLGCHLESDLVILDVWPESLEAWLPQQWQQHHLIPKVDARCGQLDTLRQHQAIEVEGVKDGQIFKLNALSQQQPELQISATLNGKYYWFVNGRLVASETSRITLPLTRLGPYQLAVMDQLGRTTTLSFQFQY